MNSPKLTVAVVGLGVGKQHVAAYKAFPNLFDLEVICSLDEPANAAVAAEYAIPKAISSFDELLAMRDIDVIDLCTPPMLHRPQAIAALRAGKHIVCEKPLTDSLAGVDDIARAEREAGLRVMPVFQYRFGAGLQKLKRLVDGELAGAAYAASVEVHWRRRPEYYAVPWRGKFATELGGSLTGHAIHAVDMLTYVFGPVRHVFARTSTRVNPIEVEDTAAVTFEHANGALSTLSVSLGSAPESTRHRFVFANVVAESNTRAYTNSGDPWVFTPDTDALAGPIESALSEYDSSVAREATLTGNATSSGNTLVGYLPPARYDAQILRFYHCIINGTAFPVTLQDARNSIELLSAMYHSAATAQMVTLPLAQDHPAYSGWH